MAEQLQQLSDFRRDVTVPHERFAHEDCSRAARAQTLHVGPRVNAAFGHE